MRGLDPRIHVLTAVLEAKTWMAGSNPAMTIVFDVEIETVIARSTASIQTYSPDFTST
jgi:hypothetical protein